jgi:hypothetical protein
MYGDPGFVDDAWFEHERDGRHAYLLRAYEDASGLLLEIFVA